MNFKVSQLKSLTAGEVAVDDLIYVIDSNPTDGSVKSKKVTVGDLIDSRIYGISSSQFVLITGYYADPSWISSLDWSKITNAPSFVTSLSALTDVQLSTPLSGQALVYNGSKWVNQGIGELDTLATVTTRGNTTTNPITVGALTVATNLISTDIGNSRVGIGTTSPTYKLEVIGTPRFSGGSAQGAIFGAGTVINLGSDAYMLATSTAGKNAGYTISRFSTGEYASFDLLTAASLGSGWSIQMRPTSTRLDIVDRSPSDNIRMTFFNGGNIAIGTTTDSGFKLDVNGTTRLKGNVDITTSGGTNVLLAYSSYVQAWQSFYVSQSGGAHNFAVSNASSGGTAYFNNVNVGIGTTTPTYNLEVSSTTGTEIGIVSGANTIAQIDFRNRGYGLPRWTIRAGGAPDGSSGNLTFQRLGSTFPFTITSGDNVLIGFGTDAGYKLDVNGTARVSGNLTVSQSNLYMDTSADAIMYGRNAVGTEQSRIMLRSQSHGGIEIGTTWGYLALQAGPGAYTERMRITNSGLIGIGTTTPTAKLQVTGSITASSALAQGVFFNNTLVAAANNDVLVGLDINPTFTNGAFTGVANLSIRGAGWIQANGGFAVGSSAYSGGIPINGLTISGAAPAKYYVGSGGGFSHSFRTASNDLVGERLRITDAFTAVLNGNLLVNTTTDAGYKLDVAGSVRLTQGLTVDYLGVKIGGVTLLLDAQGTGTISSANSVGGATTYITMSGPVYYNPTSGVAGTFAVTGQSRMNSGTATFNTLTVAPTINNTATYSGIFRGLYYNPTLTSLTGTTHRAIETTSGNVIFNGGNVGIGTSSPTGRNGYGGGTLVELVDNAAYSSFNLNGGNISSPTYFTLGAQGAGADIRVNNKPLRIAVNSVDVLTIPTTGNVLINTTTDASYKLDVNGTARVNNIFYVTNSAYTGSLRIEAFANNQQRIIGANGENITFGAAGNTMHLNATETYFSGSLLGGGFWMQSNGNTVIGAQSTPPASALVEIRSTTKGFLKPRLTTTEKNAITSPATGLEVYDSTTNTPNYFNGTTWVGVASNQSTGLSPGLFSQTSDSVAVTNTTVESSLISTGVGTLSVPANGFQVGASYIAYLSGVMSSQNNATMEIHLRSNGFVLADTNPMILSATTGKFWELHVNFVIRAIGGGGVAAIVTSGRFSYNKDSGNTPESLGFSGVNNTTFDTTINNTLAVTATWGNASPSNSIQTRIFNLYRVY